MKAVLRAVKLIAIVLAIVSLPLVVTGWGIVVPIAFGAFAFLLEKQTTRPSASSMSRSLIVYDIGVGCAGLASFVGLNFVASVGNIDTTGKPNQGFLLLAGLVILIVTITLIAIGHRNARK